GYAQARAVYNAMIDKHPAAIARCRDTADVIACVRFAREHGVEIAVRGGGHNAGGLGVADDALVIDLSQLRSTTVDPENHTVRADPGCTWGDIDHATVAFGMATPSGFIASTGVAGLTLGGGIGYLSRRFGLTVDNLLSADVVLADGTFVTASASSHSDLFWALRGGGGNFGVVTSFTFRCHDIGERGAVIAGPVLYDVADTAVDVHRKYGEQLPTGHSTMHMYPIDGAASRVPADATAFAYRDGGWAGVIVGVDPDPANAGLISQWARDYWQELHPTSAGGAYINFMMDEGQDRVKASYRGNYGRLAQVKDRYDPGNTFHINQNILPASEPSPQAGKNVT